LNLLYDRPSLQIDDRNIIEEPFAVKAVRSSVDSPTPPRSRTHSNRAGGSVPRRIDEKQAAGRAGGLSAVTIT
jgi:hypothetical protein